MGKAKARRKAGKKNRARSDATNRESIEEQNGHLSELKEQSADSSCHSKSKTDNCINMKCLHCPRCIVKERLEFIRPLFHLRKNIKVRPTIGVKPPNKMGGYCDGDSDDGDSKQRKTQTSAVGVDWPPLAEAIDTSIAKLRDDLILFNDVWFSEILCHEGECDAPTQGFGIVTTDRILFFLTAFIHNQLKYKNEFQDAFEKTLPIGDRIKKHLCTFAVGHQKMVQQHVMDFALQICRWEAVVCGMFGQLGQITRFAGKFRNACQLFRLEEGRYAPLLKPGHSCDRLYGGIRDKDLWRWYRGKNCNDCEMTRNFEKISLRCSTCFKTEDDCGGKKHLLCCVCMNALYCSKKCQKTSWKNHKKVCKYNSIGPYDVYVRHDGKTLVITEAK